MTAAPHHPASVDPEIARGRRRVWWKTLLRAEKAPLQVSDESFAHTIGVGKSQGQRWLNHGSDDSLPLADVEALPEPMFRAVVEQLAGKLGMRLVPAEGAADDTAGGLSRFARLQSEVHDVLALFFAAVKRGVLAGAAASDLRREIREAVRELMALDALAERAEHERVLGVDSRSDARRADACTPGGGSNGSAATQVENGNGAPAE